MRGGSRKRIEHTHLLGVVETLEVVVCLCGALARDIGLGIALRTNVS